MAQVNKEAEQTLEKHRSARNVAEATVIKVILDAQGCFAGHVGNIRHFQERVSTPVIGSSLPKPLLAAASRIGTFLRLS